MNDSELLDELMDLTGEKKEAKSPEEQLKMEIEAKDKEYKNLGQAYMLLKKEGELVEVCCFYKLIFCR